MTSFAARMFELRGGITQARAGELVGVSDKTVREWEKGESWPGFWNIMAIADQTGAPADYVMGRSDDWSAEPAWWATELREGGARRARRPTPKQREAMRAAEALADQDDPGRSQQGDQQAS